jgi:ribosomal-protein-alanine N-acetyltransferase
MTITAAPWSSSVNGTSGRLLFQLPLPVLTALANGDLDTANSLSKLELTPYLISPECTGVWKMRRDQVELDPLDAVWVTRLVIDSETKAVVGRAGFHGPPNENGMVEVGYSIDTAERRKGHAKAALNILLDVARRDERIKVVRASVRPDNIASRSLIDKAGFREVGDQWDEEDGLEIVLEISVDGTGNIDERGSRI